MIPGSHIFARITIHVIVHCQIEKATTITGLTWPITTTKSDTSIKPHFTIIIHIIGTPIYTII